jgi:hypothetical protein
MRYFTEALETKSSVVFKSQVQHELGNGKNIRGFSIPNLIQSDNSLSPISGGDERNVPVRPSTAKNRHLQLLLSLAVQ